MTTFDADRIKKLALMRLKNIKNINEILNNSHNDPGNGAIPLHWLYAYIERFNPDFSRDEIKEALFVLLGFLLDNQMECLAGIYDEDRGSEVIYKGSTKELLTLLNKHFKEDFPSSADDIELFFWNFKYCFIDWLVPYPLDWRKFI